MYSSKRVNKNNDFFSIHTLQESIVNYLVGNPMFLDCFVLIQLLSLNTWKGIASHQICQRSTNIVNQICFQLQKVIQNTPYHCTAYICQYRISYANKKRMFIFIFVIIILYLKLSMTFNNFCKISFVPTTCIRQLALF